MSNKLKVKANKTPPPHAMDTATLAAQAEAELTRARFKEATELYKELLKRERRPDWIDALAACYAGRAQVLAEKGMFKEALVLWRNRHELCGKSLAEVSYLSWLLQAGEVSEAMRLLVDPALPEAMRAKLEMRFAGMALTWPDNKLSELSSQLPADSPLLRQRPAAQAALRACQQGDLAALDESLRVISIRSPYRDLKPLLKALALLPSDHATAAAMIARLPVDGPFERLAAALRVAILPDTQWLAALHDLDTESQQLLLDLKGCSDALRPLLLNLARLGAQPNPETWFDFLLRHRRELPAGLAADMCRRLLPHVPHRLKTYGDTLGQLSERERTHITALTAEAQHKRSLAMPHWQRLAELLAADAPSNPNSKQRAALIWRRLSGIDIAALGDSDEIVSDCLRRCVELDPDVRDTQLRLIDALRQQGELQQARAALERALPRFPKDAGLLLEAVQVALAGKAFKKAVGLAKQVLELDPINPTVRWLIGQAHFAHARKQIKTNNLAAAHKELDAAAEWLRAGEDAATLNLLRALASDERPDARIREALADLGGGLVGNPAGNLAGAFHLTLEAGRLGMNAAMLLKQGGVDLNATPTPGAMVMLIRAVEAADEPGKTVRAALLPLHPALKRAKVGRYAEADMVSICEAFLRVEAYDLLRLYAEAALKHWPRRPLFVYFNAASYSAKPYMTPKRLRNELDHAAEACQQNDRRTGQRIQRLFDAIEDDMPFADVDDEFGGLDVNDPGVIFEALLQIGGEEALFRTVRQTMGKTTFDALRKELGGNDKDFARALIKFLAQEAGFSDISPPPFKKSVPYEPKPRNPVPDTQGNLFDD